VAFQELQKLAALEAKKPGALPESSRT